MTHHFTLRCVELGRPPTQNQRRRQHFYEQHQSAKAWQDAFYLLAKEAKMPAMKEIAVTVLPHYSTRRSLPDTDAVSPAAKAAIDGLVMAGIIPDDSSRYVSSICYHRPLVDGQDGLTLKIEETR